MFGVAKDLKPHVRYSKAQRKTTALIIWLTTDQEAHSLLWNVVRLYARCSIFQMADTAVYMPYTPATAQGLLCMHADIAHQEAQLARARPAAA